MTCQKEAAQAQQTLTQKGGVCPPIDYTGNKQAEQERQFLKECSQDPRDLNPKAVQRLMSQLLGGYLTPRDLHEHFQFEMSLPNFEREVDQIYNQAIPAAQPTKVFQDWLVKLRFG